ncbi:MAG TPA: RNA 2',3'-cyclic phosphodiesterase [Candidatus Lachnoclostridium pullistercoris]|uniref:RNA 2',3'-cyclic phosphodiesterase n=1 Tax=Candidatus Lachnoclostridium pullistercoris TaxID=2838632 RepID=A0A9D2T5I2_9FIRM|nr:RNA 2',3'-cyclic phosphodiesterase [Candidatus Lachnoclostridium pullistercoris]
MRLFVAIDLSDEMKKELVGCMHDLKRQGVEGNFVPAKNLHMTLAFIGEYGDPGRVKEAMGKVPMPEFRLSLAEKGNFGDILWVGVKGNQKLKTYVKDLRAALAADGIPCSKDKFVPHITLVRKCSAKKSYQMQVPKADMMVKRAVLMKSERKDGKMVYKEV